MFLVGVLSAWSVAHLGLALFFGLAYLLRPREREYLLFALLCTAFSVLTASVAVEFSSSVVERQYSADQFTHAAAIMAAVFNVHFALSFARRGQPLPIMRWLYAGAIAFVAAVFLELLWVPSSYRPRTAHVLGMAIAHGDGEVTPVGILFYVAGASATCAAIWGFWQAYRSGRREVWAMLIASPLIAGATLHDVCLAAGAIDNSVVLLPHVFMLYALAAGGTLLVRYRAAAGALEQTATNLKQRTEELRHSHAELVQVQNELVTKKQLAAVGELAAAIAHEVRNPLAVIVNAVAGLRRPGLRPEDGTMLLDIVEEEAGRLNRLVTDLLRFARPVNVKRTPVSLIELAKRCRTNIASGFQVEVQASDDPELQSVDVDPNLFRLVFDNLVANACQAMGDAGTVEIRVEKAELRGESAARVEIRDRGHGMDQHVLGRALDPFFTTRPSGTGLGLPIVQRIVEAHGGELMLDSLEGEGTRVVLVVPMHASAEKGESAPRELMA
ncbi:MAG TPA: ATP-binding protein [Polyangiaceae bacterium]|nr:ATP-binding protein [Polyangiaceae bacterium]